MSLETVLISFVLFFLIAAVIVVQWEKSEERKYKALVIDEVIEVFGDSEKANDWLNRKNLALGKTPNSMLGTPTGVDEVRRLLSAISAGGVV